MVNAFDKHCQEANRFIRDLALQLGTPDDTDHAIRMVRCVFIALRRRMVPDESLHFISQLPLVLKGLYVDGWNINEPLSEAKTFDEFLFEIKHFTELKADMDFENGELAHKKITAVFEVLRKYVSKGESGHTRNELPKEMASMV